MEDSDRLPLVTRPAWTAVLALGIGLATAATTVAVILWVTNDMRLMLLLGAVYIAVQRHTAPTVAVSAQVPFSAAGPDVTPTACGMARLE